MGKPRPPLPVMLVLAITSRYESAFSWAIQRAQQDWGPVWKSGPRFAFDQTRFYESTMGDRLMKQLVAFDQLVDPEELASCKLRSNDWEDQFADLEPPDVQRPLNLDPGYITEAKLVLATVKNRDHRIYLRDGIYAEVTMAYHGKQWNGQRWTYPDYLTDENLQFLTDCRNELRRRIHLGPATD
jgi:hypothetical protein